MMKYKRKLLKLSGEALMGNNSFGIDSTRLYDYANEIKKIQRAGVEVAIVIGGGNIFRGVSLNNAGLDRVQSDYMGMLGTIINGLALQSALENIKVPTRLQTAINIEAIAEPYIKRRAVRRLEKNRVVIFSARDSQKKILDVASKCYAFLKHMLFYQFWYSNYYLF